MKYKNYYEILELKNSKVTDDEIKSAYRKLAKKYHPDINPGNMHAAEKFKDINEAYEVLTDEEKKRRYNVKHYAYSFKNILDINNIKEKIDSSGASEFVEMFVGKQESNKKRPKNKHENIHGENIESEISITLEEAFNGVTKKISFKGYDDKMKNITVKVPRGIVNGGKIRIKGQGKPGKKGGISGDLYIKINILQNKQYILDKANLILDLPITPSEAVLGCNIEIEGIDSKININIKPGTESGELIYIKEKGYFNEKGERGDLIAKTKLVIPKEISKQERELYEKIQKITSFMPRQD